MNLIKETNIRLIQAAVGRTGSTVLSNILQGLFYPTEPLKYGRFKDERDVRMLLSKYFVIKTHSRNVTELINEIYGDTYEYWIISSNRNDRIYRCTHPNFISFEYEELLETETLSIEMIVNMVAQKLKIVLPVVITDQMDVNGSIDRIKEMNAFYEKIKNEPFKYSDTFFRIHGHHRTKKQYFASRSTQVT